ncbi:hypothetical protein VNO80_03680 [Phaseolus coccineus]|uniref:Uncharacterized protein n=1 Tax=Phaseolus coccineus TaxID=3886 RepID=A0AAN9RNT1_PHACN
MELLCRSHRHYSSSFTLPYDCIAMEHMSMVELDFAEVSAWIKMHALSLTTGQLDRKREKRTSCISLKERAHVRDKSIDMYGSFNGYKLGAFGLLVTIETAFTHKSEWVEPLEILFSRTGSNG